MARRHLTHTTPSQDKVYQRARQASNTDDVNDLVDVVTDLADVCQELDTTVQVMFERAVAAEARLAAMPTTHQVLAERLKGI